NLRVYLGPNRFGKGFSFVLGAPHPVRHRIDTLLLLMDFMCWMPIFFPFKSMHWTICLVVSADVIADFGSPVVAFGYTFTVQSGLRVALDGGTDPRGGRAATAENNGGVLL